MKKIILRYCFITIILLIAFFAVFAYSNSGGKEVNYGRIINDSDNKPIQVFELKKNTFDGFNRNFIVFSENVSEYKISDLIRENKDIVMARYFDEENQQYYSYLSIRGGKGKDFIIKPHIEYVFVISRNMNLSVNVTS